MEKFIDAEYLSAKEKGQIHKHFERFVNGGFQRNDFANRLYEHLHLHCGFIAHYSISGFYDTYFNGNKNELETFVEHFLEREELSGGYKYNGYNCADKPYRDINVAMANILYDKLYKNNKKVLIK